MREAFRFGASAIFLVRSLPQCDEGVARRVAEQLQDESRVLDGIPVEHEAVGSYAEFSHLVDELGRRADTGFRPMLHIDAHGSSAGVQFANGEMVEWDLVVGRLRELNKRTRMNLVVSLGVCEGAAALLGVKNEWRAPFVALLAPTAPIRSSAVESWVLSLYRGVIRDRPLGDNLRAADASIGDLGKFARCSFKDLFDMGLEGYLRDHCDRAALRARAARILRGLRRGGRFLPVGHATSLLFFALKPTAKDCEELWGKFCWHDIGGDVACRTARKFDESVNMGRRLKNGKSRRRQIKRRARSQVMYGRLLSYVAAIQDARQLEDVSSFLDKLGVRRIE